MSRQDKIGTHKTAVYTDSDGATCVKYHNTVVFKLSAPRACIIDGKPYRLVTLNSGGWQTATTKARINQAFRQLLGNDTFYYVFQRKFNWYIGRYLGNGEHDRVSEFDDGIEFRVQS